MLAKVPIPGILVTATDTGVGKTVIAGAIARWLKGDGRRVAVCKPAASGCVKRREGLVSEDAEFLAHCASARHPLDLICPQRFLEPLAPGVAAQRAGVQLDWESIDRSIRLMAADSDVMVVEGVGGVIVPMDERHTFLDVVEWLGLPTVVVARAELGTINHTLLTLAALRSRGVAVAGVVVNRYPTDTPGVAAETNPRAIEKWGKTMVLAVVPDEKLPADPWADPIPPGIAAAVGAVDWWPVATKKRPDVKIK
jgi:dethiobiotin synthetase